MNQEKPFWKQVVSPYEHSQNWRANWQLINTLVLYAVLWLAMYFSLSVNHWITLGFAVIGAGLATRIFIFFHDCGHGSFYHSRKANKWIGFILGVLVFTPSYLWWHEHSLHHATAGNLDKRGVGDIWTMTAQEYLRASRWKRIRYRVCRDPMALLVIGAPFVFLILNRFPSKNASKKARRSVHLTNLGILVMAVALSFVIGFKAYLLIQLPIIFIASMVGLWLFYVQHQFEGTYWRRTKDWQYEEVGLAGSTYYKLPAILRWFTGNIGFHHIHHLSPRIPNYFLKKCHQENALFLNIKPLTPLASLHSMILHVWDEQNHELITFHEMRRRLAAGAINLRRPNRVG